MIQKVLYFNLYILELEDNSDLYRVSIFGTVRRLRE